MLRQVVIAGVPHDARPLRVEDVMPGAMVRHREHISVYRILCKDGDDIILRNVRRPGIFETVTMADLRGEEYLYVSP